MVPLAVVVRHVFSHKTAYVPGAEWDDAMKTLVFDGAEATRKRWPAPSLASPIRLTSAALLHHTGLTQNGGSYGNLYGMITTMDSAGRLVIPREIRREAALEPGVPLEVRWRDGVIEIEPQPLEVTLRKRGRLLVATPSAPVPPLRRTTVERTRRELATRRGRR